MEADAKPGVYACLRCKTRKIKCDRGMPKCTPCERANGACLTIDPASGRQIPRGYLSHLESRVQELESELMQSRRGGPWASYSWVPDIESPYHGAASGFSLVADFSKMLLRDRTERRTPQNEGRSSDVRRSQEAGPANGHANWRLPMDLPTKSQAEELMRLYFEKSNSIVPVLHREQFVTEMFEPIYGPISPDLQLCSRYTPLRLKRSAGEPGAGTFYRRWVDSGGSFTSQLESRTQICLFFLYIILALGSVTKQKLSDSPTDEYVRYHSAAMLYYSVVAYAMGPSHNRERSLQALLLRAVYGILIPSHPSAWYTAGTAVRMCIDMGLHKVDRIKHEDVKSFFEVDMHRRLFWCSYYVDRLASVYLGRPVNIADEDIQCEYPSLIDDSWLIPPNSSQSGSADPSLEFSKPKDVTTAFAPGPEADSLIEFGNATSHPELIAPDRPSYKWISRIVLQLRRIQHVTKSELYDRADFDDVVDIRGVRDKIAADLDNWYESIPTDCDIFNFGFDRRYLDLSYHYTMVLLFRSSRGIPNPTLDETRRMLNAGDRVLNMYVDYHTNTEFAYSWAAIHNVMHAASSCLFGLYRTNALNGEYNLDSFEVLMNKTMVVVSNIKTPSETFTTAYGPLNAMTQVALDFLRSRQIEPASKRAKMVSQLKQRSEDGGRQPYPLDVNRQLPVSTTDAPPSDPFLLQSNGIDNMPFVDSSEPQELRVRQLMSHLSPMSTENYLDVSNTTASNGESSLPAQFEPTNIDDNRQPLVADVDGLPAHHDLNDPSTINADEALKSEFAHFIEEQQQYNQYQPYDLLDEVTQFFEGNSFAPSFP